MQEELIRRIAETDYCLTYKPKIKTWFVKHFNGEEAGKVYTEIKTKKRVSDQSSQTNDFKFLVNKMEIILEPKGTDMKKFRTWITESLFLIKEDYREWSKENEKHKVKEQELDKEQKKLELELLIREGEMILVSKDRPIHWIFEQVRWYSAGEEFNILYAFLAYCSQVILKEPISVIGIGDGGSGKTHILERGLSMIPDEFIITIKSTTDAALYGFCDIDPWAFDGMIVNIGDMGGKDDHKEAQNFKDAMKELQSDGKMARVIRLPTFDGGHENVTKELFGFPCLTYTNVPGYMFDGQETSRSIFLTPRNDNDDMVKIYDYVTRARNSLISSEYLKHYEEQKNIKKAILAIKKKLEDFEVINLYADFISDFLKGTKYFKRDNKKYTSILKVISILNGYNREIINGKLFTTQADVALFIELLISYRESITSNLSPPAQAILTDLQENDDRWDIHDLGITVNEYIQHTNTIKYAKRSIQKYFGELNSEGYLVKVDGTMSSGYKYKLLDSQIMDEMKVELTPLDIMLAQEVHGLTEEQVKEITEAEMVLLRSLEFEENPLWTQDKYLNPRKM